MVERTLGWGQIRVRLPTGPAGHSGLKGRFPLFARQVLFLREREVLRLLGVIFRSTQVHSTALQNTVAELTNQFLQQMVLRHYPNPHLWQLVETQPV